MGASRLHTGAFTVHPNEAVTTAIAVVIPIAIVPNTARARHGTVVIGAISPGAGRVLVADMTLARVTRRRRNI
jgi:hypothetical protein